MSVYRSVYMSEHMFVFVSVCMCVCVSVCLSVSVSLCLYSLSCSLSQTLFASSLSLDQELNSWWHAAWQAPRWLSALGTDREAQSFDWPTAAADATVSMNTDAPSLDTHSSVQDAFTQTGSSAQDCGPSPHLFQEALHDPGPASGH